MDDYHAENKRYTDGRSALKAFAPAEILFGVKAYANLLEH